MGWVTLKVVVKEEVVDTTTKISSVKQDTFTDFTVTMSKALETVATSDFSMVRDDDNQVITVKNASLDATDKTKVKLTVYTSLTDAKTYTVTYTAADEAKTQSSAKVTVTDGTVAAVNITPVEITANAATKIEYRTLDANGVIISQKGVTSPETKVDVTWDSVLGTMDNSNSNYILYNVGDTAEFTVTYHTYKYDTTTGAETGVITQKFTVTAVKDASTITQYNYTAAIDEPFDWSKVTPKQTIALDDEGAAQRKAWFLIKDSKGNDVTATCEYTVESSDNSIVVADGAVAGGVQLSPVAKGSAYLMIKDKDGKVVNTMPITVGDKRTLATFKLSTAVVNVVSSASTTAPVTCGYTDITAKDQYGEDISVALEVDNSKSSSSHSDLNFTTPGSIQVVGENDGASANAGSDNYIIKATDGLGKTMNTSLRVNSIDAKGATAYSVVFLNDDDKVVTSVDTTISESASATLNQQELDAVVVEKQSGVVVKAATGVTVTSLTVKKNDGSIVAKVVSGDAAHITSGVAIDGDDIKNITGAALTGTERVTTIVRKVTGTKAEKYLGVGTYQYYYELEKTVSGKTVKDKAVANFNVTDTQTAVIAKVKATDFGGNGGGDIKSALNNEDYIEYYYGAKKVSAAAAPTAAKATLSNGSKNIYVTNVTVEVPVAASGKTMVVTPSVSKTFTTSAGTWTNP